MGTFDYSNLKSQGKDAQESVKNGGSKPLTEGEYACVFREGERTKSQGRGGKPKRPMWVNLWRISAKDPVEEMRKKDLKLLYFMGEEDWCVFHRERFLANMIELGVDLDKINKDEDWDDVFDELEEYRCKVKIKVWYADDDKENGVPIKGAYPEKRVVGVIEGLPAEAAFSIDGGCEAAVETPAVEAPKEEEPKVVEAPAETTEDSDDDSWD